MWNYLIYFFIIFDVQTLRWKLQPFSDKQTNTHTHGVLWLTEESRLQARELTPIAVSISSLKAHFSSELGPVIEPRDKSLKINHFALTGSAYYSVILLLQHFSFHCGRKGLVFVHIKLHNHCAACKWLAPIDGCKWYLCEGHKIKTIERVASCGPWWGCRLYGLCVRLM